MSQLDHQTIEQIFEELRKIGLDANAEFCTLLLKHFGEHRLLIQISKESMDRAVFYFNKYKQTQEELALVKAKLAAYEDLDEES